MGISYVFTQHELIMLARLFGHGGLTGFSELPVLNEQESTAVLMGLKEKGMAVVRGNEAVIEPVIRLIIDTVASPEITVKCVQSGALGFAIRHFGVVARPDRHSAGRYVITPARNAKELAEMLFDDDFIGGGQRVDIITGKASESESLDLDESALGQMLEQVYMCVEERLA